MHNQRQHRPAQRSFMATMNAMAWSFFGVRRRRDLELDNGRLNPLYVIAAAFLGVALLIGTLLAVVRAVTQ